MALGHCLGLLIQFWGLYPVFAVLKPAVGGLYQSGLGEQKRNGPFSTYAKAGSRGTVVAGGHLLTQRVLFVRLQHQVLSQVISLVHTDPKFPSLK